MMEATVPSSTTMSNNSGESSSARITPSIYEDAAYDLNYERQLEYNDDVNPNNRPRNVNDVWRDIVGLFKEEPSTGGSMLFASAVVVDHSNVALTTCTDDFKELKGVLRDNYADENAFNVTLFDKLRTCLEKQDLVDKCHSENIKKQSSEPIVFKNGKSGDYAVSIIRNAGEPKLHTSGTKSDSESTESDSGLGAGTSCDHSACLLKIKNEAKLLEVGEGQMHCLSVVKLTMAAGRSTCDALEEASKEKSTQEKENIKRNDQEKNISKQDNEEKDDNMNDITGNGAKKVIDKALHNTYGSLAQVMAYTMAWVVPNLARIGQLDKEIPWCVIVGNSSTVSRKPSHPSRWCRWVSGKIYVSEQCGDRFKYAMTGFEGSHADEIDTTLDHALSVYLETILFGLRAAKKWLDKLQIGKKDYPSAITSGQKVIIGKIELPNLELRGRAGGLSETDPNFSSQWKVSQGEVFTGMLNIHPLKHEYNFFTFDDKDEEVDVVVKVCSSAVHRFLTKPEDTWTVFVKIRDAMTTAETIAEKDATIAEKDATIAEKDATAAEKSRLNTLAIKSAEAGNFVEVKTLLARMAALDEPLDEQPTEQNRSYDETTSTRPSGTRLPLAQALSKVLLAVHRTPIGLITIMVNLAEQKYMPLCPNTFKGDLSVLWKAFCELLKEVLIPLAGLGLIHPDIRPGYDETANVLYKMEATNGHEKADVKLIDYESVLRIDVWMSFKKTDTLYIESKPNARIFLRWQCVAIAYAWERGLTQKQMADIDLTEVVKQDPRPDWLEPFFSDNVTPEMEMNASLVVHLEKIKFPNAGNNTAPNASSMPRLQRCIGVLQRSRDCVQR